MNLRTILCTMNGHRWVESQKREGFFTCVQCRTRRSREWMLEHPKEILVR